LINQIKAKDKTKRVIKSCITDEHYEVAKRMLEQYNNKFEDFVGYNELKRMMSKEHQEKIYQQFLNQNKDE